MKSSDGVCVRVAAYMRVFSINMYTNVLCVCMGPALLCVLA